MVSLDSLMFQVHADLNNNMVYCMLLKFVDFKEKPEVMSELFATISKLVVRNEFCQAVMEMGGIHLILSAFQDSIAKKVIEGQFTVIMWLKSNRIILYKNFYKL